MRNVTILLLNKYPSDIKVLDISNKKINGILDISKFINLEN